MKILITGATGFVAQTLVPLLVKNNHKLVILTRSPQKAKNQWGEALDYYPWDALKEAPPKEAFDGIEAVLHLAGEGIADRRWSKKQKTKILESRTLGTQHLVEGLKQHLKSPLEVFVSTSAIGYYPESDFSNPLTETSPKGEGFLADVCDAWEKAADASSIAKRQVVIRTGVVLGVSGGALKKMLPIFRLGLGGPLGFGKAYFSFIHELDLARIYLAALTLPSFNGVYNATTPFPVTNKQMTEKLAKTLNRPAFFPVPTLALRLVFGEMSQILLNSQCVVPKKLLNHNFEFLYPTLESALKEIFKPKS